MSRLALGFLVWILHFNSVGLGASSLADLLGHLEYDHQIRGLYIPQSWFAEMRGNLFIGSARIIPDSGNLYCLGWKPALCLDQVEYSGLKDDFFRLACNLAKQNQTRLLLTRVRTKDHPTGFSCTVNPSGNIETNL